MNVTQDENVSNAASLMLKRNFRHLPVITHEGNILGIISAQDVVDALNLALLSHSTPAEIIRALEIPVQRIMTLQPTVVERGDDILRILKKMCYSNISALPIVDEQGIIKGIITLRDLVDLMGISSELLGVRVSEIMDTDISSVESSSSIWKAVQLMSEKRVRRLPVLLENGKLLGVLTNKDILRYMTKLALDESREALDMKISQLLTREAVTISHQEDIRVAASRMKVFGVGGLVVLDHPLSGIGLITERDLIRTLSERRSFGFTVSALQFEGELKTS